MCSALQCVALCCSVLQCVAVASSFDHVSQVRDDISGQLKNEHVFSRAASQVLAVGDPLSTLGLAPPVSTVCRPMAFTISPNPPPCHIIQDDWFEARDLWNYTYYEMLTPSIRKNGPAKDRYLFDPAKQWLNYNASKFPSWCGKSVTFSMWLERSNGYKVDGTSDNSVYLMSKSQAQRVTFDGATYKRWWIYKSGADQITGSDVRFRANAPSCKNDCGLITGPEFLAKTDILDRRLTPSPTFSHVGIVIDTEDNKITTYYDGKQVAEKAFPPGHLASMDCDFNGPDAYVALNHKPVNGNPNTDAASNSMAGRAADWRMYVGTKITAPEMLVLATQSEDSHGFNYQECKTRDSAGDDATYADTAGHDCNWYRETRKGELGICSSRAVRTACPEACGLAVACFDPSVEKDSWYQLGNRIVAAVSETQEPSVVCTREGFDAYQECLASTASGKAWPAPAISQVPDTKMGSVNFADCQDVQKKVDASCQFTYADPGENLQNMHQLVAYSGAITIMFWFKLSQMEAETARVNEMTLYQSVYPQRRLLKMSLVAGGQFQLYGTCSSKTQVADVASPVTFKSGQWYFIAVAWSAGGKFRLTVNTATAYDADIEERWCVPHVDSSGSTDLIQAVEFRGGSRWDVSAFSVIAQLVPIKQLQELYSTGAINFRMRHGSRVPDHVTGRGNYRIPYERSRYSYQAALVAPPLLLQKRWLSSSDCNTALGSHFQKVLWNTVVNGTTCSEPFVCDNKLRENSQEFLSCARTPSKDEMALQKFFVRTPIELKGALVFAEFVQTIVESKIVVRDLEPIETQSFIDSQTREVQISMTGFSAQYGIASCITVTALFGTDMRASWNIEHLQSLEGAELSQYTTCIVIGLVLACVIAIEKILDLNLDWSWLKGVWKAENEDKKDLSNMQDEETLEKASKAASFVADILIQFLLPVIYFSLRLSQIRNSKSVISKTIGDNDGLLSVPWPAVDVVLDTNMNQMFKAIEAIQGALLVERVMKAFYFVHATLALLRMLAQTKTHPRLSMLVGTLQHARDDLWHFLLLMSFVLGGFMLLARAQFADTFEEFSEFTSSLEFL